jgi:hypothetical protein
VEQVEEEDPKAGIDFHLFLCFLPSFTHTHQHRLHMASNSHQVPVAASIPANDDTSTLVTPATNMRIRTFHELLLETPVFFHILHMKQSAFIWVGTSDASFASLCIGAPLASVCEPLQHVPV